MTTFSPLKRRYAFIKRISWTLGLLLARLGVRRPVHLRKLSMIGFARWSIVKQAPLASQGGAFRKLQSPYILFETNFNGDSDNYLEAFSLITTKGMRTMWKGTYGLPDIKRVSKFQGFVNQNKLCITRYHAGYQVDSTKMVRTALEVKRLHDRLNPLAERVDERRFLEAYEHFLTAARKKDPHAAPAGGLPKTGALTALTPVAHARLSSLRSAIAGVTADWAPPSTHFARWVVVPCLCPPEGMPRQEESYLLFSAWFDGPRNHYLAELHRRLGATAVQRIWGPDFPGGDANAFRSYLVAHEVKVGVPFAAYDGVTVSEVKRALDVTHKVSAFAVDNQELTAPARAAELQQAWIKEFL